MSRIPEEVDRLLVFEKKLRQRKREEIREGMIDIIKHSVPNFIYPFLMIPTRWLVNKILKFLHSQGVVIKVDRELPEFRLFVDLPQYHNGLSHPYLQAQVDRQSDMLKAGYVAVEPLIELDNMG